MTELGKSIQALRKKLGSVERELAYGALARILTANLKRKPPIAGSTILKWEQGVGGQPDPLALLEMARLAGVSVEEFVLGKKEADARQDAAERAAASGIQMYYGAPIAKQAPDDKRAQGGRGKGR